MVSDYTQKRYEEYLVWSLAAPLWGEEANYEHFVKIYDKFNRWK